MDEKKEVPHSQSRFLQQRLPACHPRFSPCVSSIFYLAISVISLIFAICYLLANQDLFEVVTRYDDVCDGKATCQVTVHFDKDIKSQLFVYYELSKFYQVNFMYTSSKSWKQLEGEFVEESDLKKCNPLLKDSNDIVYAPCGTVPLSVFNDTFQFDSKLPKFTDEGITIPSIWKFFKQTNEKYPKAGAWLDNNTLFEDGQQNERFVNWIQTAAFPKFRKLWAKTSNDVDIPKGDYVVTITNNFPVSSFKGTKSIVFTETSWTGGRNMFLPYFFFVVFGVSFAISIILAILYFTNAFPLYKAIANNDSPLHKKML
ncbi:membrane protein [Tritrichomonas foetus]|uniref:Membrane protein n=1 Tax=Tritrichomonas foetus TaxID=1144522 RepID=A0A1J4JBR8_9EUKA|nr:membrane protein [Tritrichomonas foetus]|eukprot:OHS96642.1 membrane protein [Tritrichomonas foetus]